MATTIRMRRCGIDSTLTGYIFTDRTHAHLWLLRFIEEGRMNGFAFDEVQTGPIVKCPRCGGSGIHQSVKTVRRLTIEEIMQ